MIKPEDNTVKLEPIHRDKKIQFPRGFEDYAFEIPHIDLPTEEIEQVLNQYYGGGGTVGKMTCEDVIECVEDSGILEDDEDYQHFGGTTELHSSGQNTITYADVIGIATIQVVGKPRIIPHCDREFILDSFDNTSLTVRPSALGVADTPLSLGVELQGIAQAVPETIYDPIIVHRTLAGDDKAWSIEWYNTAEIALKGFGFGVDDYPITCGIHIAGAETPGGMLHDYYLEFTLEQDEQIFEYADANIYVCDTHIERTTVELDDYQETFNFGSILSEPYIEDARVSGFAPLSASSGYIHDVTDSSVTIGVSGIMQEDFPVRYALEIRGH